MDYPSVETNQTTLPSPDTFLSELSSRRILRGEYFVVSVPIKKIFYSLIYRSNEV